MERSSVISKNRATLLKILNNKQVLLKNISQKNFSNIFSIVGNYHTRNNTRAYLLAGYIWEIAYKASTLQSDENYISYFDLQEMNIFTFILKLLPLPYLQGFFFFVFCFLLQFTFYHSLLPIFLNPESEVDMQTFNFSKDCLTF